MFLLIIRYIECLIMSGISNPYVKMKNSTFSGYQFFLISLLSVAAVVGTHAQAPGYLGRQTTLQFDLNTMPALGGPTASNNGLSGSLYGPHKGTFDFSNRMGLTVTHAITKNKSLFIEADQYKTGMISTYVTLTGGGDISGYEGHDYHYCFHNIINRNIGIGMQLFAYAMKGSIAPMGLYVAPSIGYSSISGSILDRKTTLDEFSNGTLNTIVLDQHFKTITCKFEIGTNYIIADRILLNVSVNTRIPLLLNVEEARVTYPSSSSNTYLIYGGDLLTINQRIFNYDSSLRIANHDAISAKIGIGFLLF